MRFTSDQSHLAKALATVTRAANGKRSPVCGHVLVTAVGETVRLKCFDLELAIEATCPAETQKVGSLLLPADLLSHIVASLPSGAPVTLQSVDQGLEAKIDAPGASMGLQGLHPDDFPNIPAAGKSTLVELPSAALTEAIAATIGAAADDIGKQVLCGVNFFMTGELVAAATNGHRLATITLPLPELVRDMPQQATIPSRTLKELARLLPSVEQCAIALGESYMTATIGDTTITSRIMDGAYPDYRRLIPKEFGSTVTVHRRDMIAAVPSRFIAEMDLNKDTVKEDPREKLKALRAEFAQRASAASAESAANK
jgi:DNA polymerase-3 subunit beta